MYLLIQTMSWTGDCSIDMRIWSLFAESKMDQLGVGNIFDELGLFSDMKNGKQEQLTFMGYLKMVRRFADAQ